MIPSWAQTAAAMTTTKYATGHPEKEKKKRMRRRRRRSKARGRLRSHVLRQSKLQPLEWLHTSPSPFSGFFVVVSVQFWISSTGTPGGFSKAVCWPLTSRISWFCVMGSDRRSLKGWATASPTGHIPNHTLLKSERLKFDTESSESD